MIVLLRYLLHTILMILTVQYMAHSYELGASTDTPRAIMSEATFIDSACIADQKITSSSFEFSQGLTNDPTLNKALKWIGTIIYTAGAVACTIITAGVCVSMTITAVAAVTGAIADEAVEGSGKKDEMMSVLKDKVKTGLPQGNQDYFTLIFKRPTNAELRLTLYNNLSRFVSTRITAQKDGNVCAEPMTNNDCTVISFKNTDGSAIKTLDIYGYTVYSALYEYIHEDVLNQGAVDILRAAVAQTYSRDVSDSLLITMAKIINSEAAFFTQGGINNQTVGTVKDKIKILADKMALALSNDILFWQPMQYSSRAESPIVSRLIECLEGTFANLLLKDLNIGVTPFAIVQSYFQPLILMLLIIYIIIYGYKILLAHGIKSNADIVMTCVEFALVFYFTIGDAWQSFFFAALKSIPTSVGTMVISTISSGADGCGVYKPHMYPAMKGNLAFFDMIDCKFANYIGLFPSVSFIPGIFYLISVSFVIPIPVIGTVVGVIAIIYFSCIVYTILLGIQIYISSVITLSVMIFLSPFTIPMCLFERTEDIYNRWLAKVIGCVIGLSFGIVVIIFVLLMFDPILYGLKPEKYLFDQATNSTSTNPKPNPMKAQCYFSGIAVPWAPKDGGIQIGTANFVPVPCLLRHLATTGVAWQGWPIDWLYFFRLPTSYRLDIMLAFILPAIFTMIFTAIVKKFIDPMSEVISSIGGEGGQDLFGAQKYDGTAHMMAEGKKGVGAVANKIKDAAKKAGNKTNKGNDKNKDEDDDKDDNGGGDDGGESGQTEGAGGGGDAGGGGEVAM